MILEFFSQALLTTLANLLMTLSKLAIFSKLDILRFLTEVVTSLMKNTSFLLSLMIEHLVVLVLSSMMGILMVRGAWSNVNHQSR